MTPCRRNYFERLLFLTLFFGAAFRTFFLLVTFLAVVFLPGTFLIVFFFRLVLLSAVFLVVIFLAAVFLAVVFSVWGFGLALFLDVTVLEELLSEVELAGNRVRI